MQKLLFKLANIKNMSAAQKWDLLNLIEQEYKKHEEESDKREELFALLKLEQDALGKVIMSVAFQEHPIAKRLSSIIRPSTDTPRIDQRELDSHNIKNIAAMRQLALDAIEANPIIEKTDVAGLSISQNARDQYIRQIDTHLCGHAQANLIRMIQLATVNQNHYFTTSFNHYLDQDRTQQLPLIEGLNAFAIVDLLSYESESESKDESVKLELISLLGNQYEMSEDHRLKLNKQLESFVYNQACKLCITQNPDRKAEIERVQTEENNRIVDGANDEFYGDPRVQHFPWVTQFLYFGLKFPEHREDIINLLTDSIVSNIRSEYGGAVACHGGNNERLVQYFYNYLISHDLIQQDSAPTLSPYQNTVSTVLFDEHGYFTEKTAIPALGRALVKQLQADDIKIIAGQAAFNTENAEALSSRMSKALREEFKLVCSSPYFALHSEHRFAKDPLAAEIKEWLCNELGAYGVIEVFLEQTICAQAKKTTSEMIADFVPDTPLSSTLLGRIRALGKTPNDLFRHINKLNIHPLYGLRKRLESIDEASTAVEEINADVERIPIEDMNHMITTRGYAEYYESKKIGIKELISEQVLEKLLAYHLNRKICLEILGELEYEIIQHQIEDLLQIRDQDVGPMDKDFLKKRVKELKTFIASNPGLSCEEIFQSVLPSTARTSERSRQRTEMFKEFLTNEIIPLLQSAARKQQDLPDRESVHEAYTSEFDNKIQEGIAISLYGMTVFGIEDSLRQSTPSTHSNSDLVFAYYREALSDAAIEIVKAALRSTQSDERVIINTASNVCDDVASVYLKTLRELMSHNLKPLESIVSAGEGELMRQFQRDNSLRTTPLAEINRLVKGKDPSSLIGIDQIDRGYFDSRQSIMDRFATIRCSDDSKNVYGKMIELDMKQQLLILGLCSFSEAEQTTHVADFVADAVYQTYEPHEYQDFNYQPFDTFLNVLYCFDEDLTQQVILGLAQSCVEHSLLLEQHPHMHDRWSRLLENLIENSELKAAYLVCSMFKGKLNLDLSDDQTTHLANLRDAPYASQLLAEGCSDINAAKLLTNPSLDLDPKQNVQILEKALRYIQGEANPAYIREIDINALYLGQSSNSAERLQAQIATAILNKSTTLKQSEIFKLGSTIEQYFKGNIDPDFFAAWSEQLDLTYIAISDFNAVAITGNSTIDTLKTLNEIAGYANKDNNIEHCLCKNFDNLSNKDVHSLLLMCANNEHKCISTLLLDRLKTFDDLEKARKALLHCSDQNETAQHLLSQIRLNMDNDCTKKPSRLYDIFKMVLTICIAIIVLVTAYFSISSLLGVSLFSAKKVVNLPKLPKTAPTIVQVPQSTLKASLRS